MARTVKNVAMCPDCGGDVYLEGKVRIGMKVTCPHCGAELEVIAVDPVELDWAIYDDEDFEDDEEQL